MARALLVQAGTRVLLVVLRSSSISRFVRLAAPLLGGTHAAHPRLLPPSSLALLTLLLMSFEEELRRPPGRDQPLSPRSDRTRPATQSSLRPDATSHSVLAPTGRDQPLSPRSERSPPRRSLAAGGWGLARRGRGAVAPVPSWLVRVRRSSALPPPLLRTVVVVALVVSSS